MENDNTEIKEIEITLLGDSCVGKTSLFYSFIGFEWDFSPTFQVSKTERIIFLENDKKIKIILWDTPGDEKYRLSALKTLKKVQGVALIFDVTSKSSFDNLNMWLYKIKENCSEFTLVLLGNKIDIDKKKWQITQKDIDKFVKQNNIKYFAISAKKNKGKSDFFKYLANTIYNKLKLKLFEENKMNLKTANKGEEKTSSSYNDDKKIK